MSFDPTRRKLLKAAATVALAGIPAEVWSLAEGEELVDFADLDGFKIENHAATPRVKFFDLRRLTSWKTPEDEFFTFHQTETAKVNAAEWRLRVDGFVERAREYTLDEIRQRPDKRDLPVTIECSGNTALGAANGQVSNGLWTGAGLASILKECGLKAEAREIAFLGMDMERYGNDTVSTAHGRSIYVQDAMDPNIMLAYALNGSPLSPERGFPLRVIVPGWYGVTQIKWLARIQVLDRRYEGTHMARNYHTVHDGDMVLETSISKTHLKSAVARVTRQKNPTGRFAYKISGAAWGGPLPVKTVEVRIDGSDWRPAKLGERQGDFAWVLWSLDWTDVKPGAHTLVSRAVDVGGNIQPTAAEWEKTVKTLRENNSQWPRRIEIKEG